MINEWIFRNLVFFPATRMMRQTVARDLTQLEDSQFFDANKMSALQDEKLRLALRKAVADVPRYSELKSQIDWSADLLSQLPVITKTDILDNREGFVSKDDLRGAVTKTTGGSTGQPVTLLKSPGAVSMELAGTWRAYGWVGLKIGSRQMRFWGVPQKSGGAVSAGIKDFLLNRKRCSAFAFNDTNLAGYYDQLKSFKPAYLYGYASMLEEFSRFIVRKGNAGKPNRELTCVISTSEVLSDSQRAVISEAFGVPVFNEYGCGEFGSIAHECTAGKMHVTSENVILEVVNDGKPANPGEVGELLVTELNNKTMPMFRYRIGDFGAVSYEPCACGVKLPILTGLFGRAYDTITSPDGRKYHGEFFLYVLEDARRSGLDVKGIQVRQSSVNALDVALVAASEDQVALVELFESRLISGMGAEMQISVSFVEAISREKSGKMRVVVGLQ